VIFFDAGFIPSKVAPVENSERGTADARRPWTSIISCENSNAHADGRPLRLGENASAVLSPALSVAAGVGFGNGRRPRFVKLVRINQSRALHGYSTIKARRTASIRVATSNIAILHVVVAC
jgi:hypothetical protein